MAAILGPGIIYIWQQLSQDGPGTIYGITVPVALYYCIAEKFQVLNFKSFHDEVQ